MYAKILEIPLNDIWKFQLETLLKQLESLEKETVKIKQKIIERVIIISQRD
jgi:hypothetical protein